MMKRILSTGGMRSPTSPISNMELELQFSTPTDNSSIGANSTVVNCRPLSPKLNSNTTTTTTATNSSGHFLTVPSCTTIQQQPPQSTTTATNSTLIDIPIASYNDDDDDNMSLNHIHHDSDLIHVSDSTINVSSSSSSSASVQQHQQQQRVVVGELSFLRSMYHHLCRTNRQQQQQQHQSSPSSPSKIPSNRTPPSSVSSYTLSTIQKLSKRPLLIVMIVISLSLLSLFYMNQKLWNSTKHYTAPFTGAVYQNRNTPQKSKSHTQTNSNNNYNNNSNNNNSNNNSLKKSVDNNHSKNEKNDASLSGSKQSKSSSSSPSSAHPKDDPSSPDAAPKSPLDEMLSNLNEEDKNQLFQSSIELFPIRFPILGDQGRGGEFGQMDLAQQLDRFCTLNKGQSDEPLLPMKGDQWSQQQQQHKSDDASSNSKKKKNTTSVDSLCPFFASTGDNFYPVGLSSIQDPQFEMSFDSVYSGKALSQIPFFTVLGNHDYYTSPELQSAITKTKGLLSTTSARRGRFYLDEKRYYYLDIYLTAPRKNPTMIQVLLDVNDKIQIHDNKILNQNSAVTKKTHMMHHLARIVFLDTVPLLGPLQKDIVKKQRLQLDQILSQNATRQIQWLHDSLDNTDAQWKLVVGHHPAHSFGWHGDNPEILKLTQIFKLYGVQAYISGHDHILQHVRDTDRLNHFITGAGSQVEGDDTPKNNVGKEHLSKLFYYASTPGFMMLELQSSRMYGEFRDVEGHLLYKSVIRKPLTDNSSSKTRK